MAYPTYTNQYQTQVQIADKTVTLTVGKFSEQVAAAVLAQCGDTVVHTTVALGRKVDLGYFPLQVEYVEKLYASGIIKGSRWIKRDGRPSDDAVLRARVIDRTMRPMFPDGISHEVQIINTVFSYDGENEPDMLALLATGFALQISEIPFEGPVVGLRVGFSKQSGEFVFNPTQTEQEQIDLDLIVSGTKDSIVMVEAGANEVTEQVIIEALTQAHQQIQAVAKVFETAQQEIGKDKVELLDQPDTELEAAKAALSELLQTEFAALVETAIKAKAMLQDPELDQLIEQVVAHQTILDWNEAHAEEGVQISESMINSAIQSEMKAAGRNMIINDGIRPDGRQLDEVRPIWCEVDIFPRTHGSAMFKRGATQAATVVTLGAPSLGQYIEDLEGESVRRYIHHYNMPPYASGEAGRVGSPKRREIGHGALAERALLPMIPDQTQFPYTIHVVSEILSSNGSTSQASVCGSTMALMAAGVPIKRPVAGIAMGLMSDGNTFRVLSDIQGLEDHVGDMDFKVAGTSEGITAIQMDIKLKGLPQQVLEEALEQAKTGRLHILSKMLECIDTPRGTLSSFAPKILQLSIPGDRIGELIGPGGKTIKDIIARSEAEIDVDENEDGTQGIVNISSSDDSKIEAAKTIITNMMRVVEKDEQFEGTVTRVESYGAFVEYLPGREGLVHVSNMATDFVSDPAALVKVGDQVTVWIHEIKDDGKIGLAMISPEQQQEVASTRQSRGKKPFRGGRQGGGRDRRRG